MGKAGEQIVVVLMAIIGVAVLAVIVSKNAQTTSVIGAVASGFNNSLSAALSPITGSTGIGNFGGVG